jgi:predicted transcriptional regulator
MRLTKKRFIFIMILFIVESYLLYLPFTIGATAQNNENGIGMRPYTPSYDPAGEFPHYTDVNYILSSFWQLPLWIQIAFISLSIMAAFALIKTFPFFFGRLKHALENPKTREIFYFIQRNPGVTIAELSDEQKINRGTLKYHLSQLLSNNKIVFIKKGKFSRLFYNTTSPMDKESIISRYLKNENSRRILFKIMDNPGISNQELSDGFELAKSTTHEYLKNFSDDEIVEFRQDGKYKRCYLKQDARMIMLRYRPQ